EPPTGVHLPLIRDPDGRDEGKVATAHATAQRGPLTAVPAGDVVGAHPPSRGENPARVHVSLLSDGHGHDVAIVTPSHAAAQRRPLPAVPTRDAISRHPPGRGEEPADIYIAVVGDGEGKGVTIHTVRKDEAVVPVLITRRQRLRGSGCAAPAPRGRAGCI